MTSTSIVNCRYYDANEKEIQQGCIQYTDGIITHVGSADDQISSEHTINAGNNLVVPGLIDCYARLREPGYEKKAVSPRYFVHQIQTRSLMNQVL